MTIEKRENLENCQVRLTIHVDMDTWRHALSACYEQLKDSYPVDGEVTRSNLEAKYGAEFLYQEAVNATYPQALTEAVAAEELLVAGVSSLDIVSIGPEGYSFWALLDLYPEVTLGQYKYLSAAFPEIALSADDEDAAIREFLQESAIAEHPGTAAMGDEVSIDFEGFVDGKAFPGGKAEQYPLVLGSGKFIPGFEEQVTGIAVEEERDISVTFPTAYAPELAGKDAVFHIKCHAITRRVAPELTEAFAAEQGFGSLSALRQQILSDKLELKAAEATDAFHDALIRQVVGSLKANIPESMVENQLDGFMAELTQQMQRQGMEMPQYLKATGLTEEALRSRFREQALAATRYELAMTEVARRENITISDQDLDNQYEELSRAYGMSTETLRQQLPPFRMRHDMALSRARAIVLETGRKC